MLKDIRKCFCKNIKNENEMKNIKNENEVKNILIFKAQQIRKIT